MVGGAAVPTHAPSRDQLTYTISVGDAPISGAVLRAYQPAAAPANPARVVVDGRVARAATVDRAGSGVLVRLGTGADRRHGGRLGIGNHTVTLNLAVNTLPDRSGDRARGRRLGRRRAGPAREIATH